MAATTEAICKCGQKYKDRRDRVYKMCNACGIIAKGNRLAGKRTLKTVRQLLKEQAAKKRKAREKRKAKKLEERKLLDIKLEKTLQQKMAAQVKAIELNQQVREDMISINNLSVAVRDAIFELQYIRGTDPPSNVEMRAVETLLESGAECVVKGYDKTSDIIEQ